MKNYSDAQIHSLIKRFEARKLPKEEWTHLAHLVAAIWYCSTFPLKEALEIVRTKISQYNESLGNSNTDSDGYHESITKFWLLTAKHFLANKSSESLSTLCDDFINSKRSQSDFILMFYSKEKLFSVEARRNWVQPDLKGIYEA